MNANFVVLLFANGRHKLPSLSQKLSAVYHKGGPLSTRLGSGLYLWGPRASPAKRGAWEGGGLYSDEGGSFRYSFPFSGVTPRTANSSSTVTNL